GFNAQLAERRARQSPARRAKCEPARPDKAVRGHGNRPADCRGTLTGPPRRLRPACRSRNIWTKTRWWPPYVGDAFTPGSSTMALTRQDYLNLDRHIRYHRSRIEAGQLRVGLSTDMTAFVHTRVALSGTVDPANGGYAHPAY